MAIITDSSWATTFFYAQDLKSAYMNGALNAGFKPGIYNSGISLYVKGSSASADGGVFLHIKRGTTFVFSNSYTDTPPYKREVSNVGSYLIKSVATEDIDISLVTVASGSTYSQAREYILGRSSTGVVPPKQFYIAAMMTYHSDKTGGYDIPKFVCAVKNASRTGGSSEEKYNYYFTTFNNDGTTDVTYPIPEGGETSASNTSIVSYLMVGTVIDKSESLTKDTYDDWSNQYTNWLNNHTLISRCFEDYRQDISNTGKVIEPAVIVGSDLKSIYVDAPAIIARDLVYKKDESPWQKVYGLYDAASGGITLSDISDLSSYKGKTVVVTDFIYAPLKSHESSITQYDISKMFASSSTSARTLTLNNYRFISEYGLATSLIKTLNESIKSSTTVIPSDMHSVTLARLRSIIENRSVLPLLTDVMRRNGVTPTSCDSIMPIALIFRGFTVDADGTVTPVDNISTTSLINPANVLSLLELDHTAAKISSIPVTVDDAYTVLPIIE